MKTFPLFLVVTILLSITTRADLTVVQKVEGVGSMNQITMKLKGNKARMEASSELTMIIDNKTGEIVNLMNKEKKFLRISADKSKAIAELAGKYSGDSAAGTAKPKVKATGKKETINGYETEEYGRETPTMKESYWIAPKYPDAAAIMNQLQAIIPAAWNNVAKGMFEYRDIPGLPLRTVVKKEGKEIISTIVSIKQDQLSDAEFSVPKDFEELKIPNLKGILSEKPSIPPSEN